MKIILSRKGFDSTAGGVASPIFPSGAMYSLPIPETPKPECGKQSIRYGDVLVGVESLGTLVEQLTHGNIRSTDYAHLDPDLRCESLYRAPNWKPLFGQAGSAEGHLQGQHVQEGDVFLFFGWFREVVPTAVGYINLPGGEDKHVIFGWFQIERRVPVTHRAEIPAWALYHPHYRGRPYNKNDALYISADRLKLPKVDRPGAGVFKRFREGLCLTAPNETRSQWRLPSWFDPRTGRIPLTYHPRMDQWTSAGTYVNLDSAKQGQEFVLDCDEYPEAIDWLADLLTLAE